MTKLELSKISAEITTIENELSILDGTNFFENRRIEQLNERLEYLDNWLSDVQRAKRFARFKVVGTPVADVVG